MHNCSQALPGALAGLCWQVLLESEHRQQVALIVTVCTFPHGKPGCAFSLTGRHVCASCVLAEDEGMKGSMPDRQTDKRATERLSSPDVRDTRFPFQI